MSVSSPEIDLENLMKCGTVCSGLSVSRAFSAHGIDDVVNSSLLSRVAKEVSGATGESGERWTINTSANLQRQHAQDGSEHPALINFINGQGMLGSWRD
jgi:hypothetical protein